MKDMFKEEAPCFRVLKNHILEYQKKVEKAKRAATAAAQACGHGYGAGSRGGRREQVMRGRGRGRGAHVQGSTGAAAAHQSHLR